jgi:hypothetical protein
MSDCDAETRKITYETLAVNRSELDHGKTADSLEIAEVQRDTSYDR